MPSLTIRDVAREAGVSVASVSEILRDETSHRFAVATVNHVREVARRLDYKTNAVARMLRKPSQNLIGFAVHPRLMADPVVNLLVVTAQNRLKELGYQPLLVEPAHMVSMSSPTPFVNPDLLSGIVSADWTLESNFPDFYASLKSALPCVAMYPVKDAIIDCVTTNRHKALELAVDHLVELGHRRIAFAASFVSSYSEEPKVEGWRSACQKHGIEVVPDYEITLPPNVKSPERGAYLAEKVMSMTARPTAIVCASDIIAIHFLYNLLKRGVNVPDDISVIGFDGHPGGEVTWPALTTVAQPIREIAFGAVARLLEIKEMRSKDMSWEPCSLLLDPVLVVRDSTSAAGGRKC